MSLTAFQQEEVRLRNEAKAINNACRALGVLSLEGMTQHRWNDLTIAEKSELLDHSGKCDQLVNLVGWRVEVIDEPGDEPRRFIVGISSGWRPCHLELNNITSSGGGPARSHYHRVTKVRAPNGRRP